MSELTCCLESECRRDNVQGFTVCHNPIALLDTFERKCPVKKELESRKETVIVKE